MKFAKVDERTYLLRLERDEEVVSTLQDFAEDQGIINAKVEGIGSIENPTLAHYRVDTKTYSEKSFQGVFEVTSLLGNIAVFEGKPLLHLHVNLGNEEMQTFGGHLVHAAVSATMEVFITVFPSKYEKKYSEEIGLKLWKLG